LTNTPTISALPAESGGNLGSDGGLDTAR